MTKKDHFSSNDSDDSRNISRMNLKRITSTYTIILYFVHTLHNTKYLKL